MLKICQSSASSGRCLRCALASSCCVPCLRWLTIYRTTPCHLAPWADDLTLPHHDVPCASQQNQLPIGSDGSIASLLRCPSCVCFPPDSDLVAGIAALRFRANRRHMQYSKDHLFGHFVADQQHLWRNVEPSDLGEKESFGSYLICRKAVSKCSDYSFYKVQDFYNTTMRPQMRNIMVATDGSDGANRAVNVAAELAKAVSATLLIVTVARALSAEEKQFMRIDRDMAEPAEVLARGALYDAERRVQQAGITSAKTILVWGNSTRAIIEAIGREKADAIVVGRRGQGQLSGLLLGSVSQKLCSLAPCVVIVVP